MAFTPNRPDAHFQPAVAERNHNPVHPLRHRRSYLSSITISKYPSHVVANRPLPYPIRFRKPRAAGTLSGARRGLIAFFLAESFPMKMPIRVAVTGPAGQIGYALLF